MRVVGLGWGRASSRDDGLISRESPGDGGRHDATAPRTLCDRSTTRRVVTTWVPTPTIAGALAFAVFGLTTA